MLDYQGESAESVLLFDYETLAAHAQELPAWMSYIGHQQAALQRNIAMMKLQKGDMEITIARRKGQLQREWRNPDEGRKSLPWDDIKYELLIDLVVVEIENKIRVLEEKIIEEEFKYVTLQKGWARPLEAKETALSLIHGQMRAEKDAIRRRQD